MQLIVPPPSAVPVCLSAMKMVATADRPLSPATTNMLMGAQRVLLHSDLALESLGPVEPEQVAQALPEPALRRQFIQAALMVVLADGAPSQAQMDRVEALATALGVEGPELRSLRLLADEHTVFFRLHFLRHSHTGEVMQRAFEEEGPLAPFKGLLAMRGYLQDPALAARYRALEQLPEGTLGREFARYLNRNHFGFPGEKGGFPEALLWHDFGHVLSGYDTDPAGEVEMAAFQAGYRRSNAFYVLLFGALTFFAGINVTPLPQPKMPGQLLSQPGMPERMLRALQRGSKLKVDLFDHWDYWPYLERNIDEVRAELGLEPA
jgi:hypothetical protein